MCPAGIKVSIATSPLQVARRVRIESLDSTFFSIERQTGHLADEGSKVAAGMEVAYTITFHPESNNDHFYKLIVVTEREKFLVPVTAMGAAPLLDMPDSISFPPTPIRKEARKSLLVRNIGSKAGSFELYATSCFSVAPSKAFLAPGETLQLSLEFSPSATGIHAGDLSVVYDNGRTTYSSLQGEGEQLPVKLSSGQLKFLPTYISKLSQKSFKVVNDSDMALSYSVKAQPTPVDDLMVTSRTLASLAQYQSKSASNRSSSSKLESSGLPWGPRSQEVGRNRASRAEGRMPDRDAAPKGRRGDCRDDCGYGAAAEEMGGWDADAEGDGDSVLEDVGLATSRELKKARRDADADSQLFCSSTFSVFPAEGIVWPHSQTEIIVQFQPDHARDFEEDAWVELQGREERQLLQLHGRGLGAQAIFSYDSLDVGEVFVNTRHIYEVELMNRGKVDAEFRLQPCHTCFGSKFSFDPEAGVLPAGAVQVSTCAGVQEVPGSLTTLAQCWNCKGLGVLLKL